MKQFMVHYPVAFYQKGDVVYDENFHLLLVVIHVMHNPTLPIFKCIATDNYTANTYLTREMPLTYSAVTKSLQYVCKKSTLIGILNRYKVSHFFADSPVGDFLWNFKALREGQE